MLIKSKIPIIRKTLRHGKKSDVFAGEIETEKLSFRYEIYGVRFDKRWRSISLNVRTYNCKYAHTGRKWYQVGEGWRGTESINRGIRRELQQEWELFFTSTFDYPTYAFEVGNIKHIK